MNWYVVDKGYVEYLKEFDDKVGNVDYGDDAFKVHTGIAYTIRDNKYYIPMCSKKAKHENMKNSIDFQKIEEVGTRRLLSVLNINNMIPVPDEYIEELKYDNIEKYRSFKNDKEKVDYIYILQLEMAAIQEMEDVLKEKAEKLYKKCEEKPDSKLAQRCCNYKLLEEKSKEYKQNRISARTI